VRAALTGHLVISTLHAGSCSGVIERLQTMCADTYAVASSVELILNQRLVRRVCEHCHGARCDACLQTGYHGRVPVLEWLRLNAAQREQFRARGLAALQPKQPIRDAARELVRGGVTNAAEFERLFSR
jgi:general secretion pathway protein E